MIRKYDAERMYEWTVEEVADELNALRLENGQLRKKVSQLRGQRDSARRRAKKYQSIVDQAKENVKSVATNYINEYRFDKLDTLRNHYYSLFNEDWDLTVYRIC